LAGMVNDWMRTVIQNNPVVAENMGFTRAVACGMNATSVFAEERFMS